LLDAIAASGTQTSDAVTANASDLQLALSRMLANGLPATGGDGANRAAAPPAAAAPAPAPAPAPRPAAAARPAAPPPNPFSYP
jgi:hypothetical protein